MAPPPPLITFLGKALITPCIIGALAVLIAGECVVGADNGSQH
jgi:hypothetical protein